MDGTLVHNMHYHKKAWIEFLDRKGYSMTEEEWEANHHGTIIEIVRRVFGEKYSDEEIYAMGEEKEALYREIYAPDLKPVEGLDAFLQKVSTYPKALATMGDRNNIDFTLSGLGLQNYFDVELGGEDANRGKPHPDIFLQAAEALQVDPGDCLVFEDSLSGIQAARAAGMEVVALATTHTVDELSSQNLNLIIEDYNHPQLINYLIT